LLRFIWDFILFVWNCGTGGRKLIRARVNRIKSLRMLLVKLIIVFTLRLLFSGCLEQYSLLCVYFLIAWKIKPKMKSLFWMVWWHMGDIWFSLLLLFLMRQGFFWDFKNILNCFGFWVDKELFLFLVRWTRPNMKHINCNHITSGVSQAHHIAL
jgi:hypothetical protein